MMPFCVSESPGDPCELADSEGLGELPRDAAQTTGGGEALDQCSQREIKRSHTRDCKFSSSHI